MKARKLMHSCLSFLTVLFASLPMIGCAQYPYSPPQGEMKVQAIFATEIEEPWDQTIHRALEQAEGKHNIKYTYVDAVSATEFEKTLRRFADRRVDLLVGDGFGSEESVRVVAKDYPQLPFVFGSGLGPSAPNLSVFDNWVHEPAYLAGMIAGELTKSNMVGAVGGKDVPEVNRLLNAFKAGAKETNPEVKFKVIFLGSWFDPAKAKESAFALLNSGTDVMYGERTGVIEACAERDIPVFGNIVDQHEIAPDVVVSSVVWDVWPTIDHVIKEIRSGNYEAEDLAEWSMMAKGGARLAPFYAWRERLGDELINTIDERREEIRSGRFRVPIVESTPLSD